MQARAVQRYYYLFLGIPDRPTHPHLRGFSALQLEAASPQRIASVAAWMVSIALPSKRLLTKVYSAFSPGR